MIEFPKTLLVGLLLGLLSQHSALAETPVVPEINAGERSDALPDISMGESSIETAAVERPAASPERRTRYGVGYEFRMQQREQTSRPERAERPSRVEQSDRPERIERPEKIERPDIIDRPTMPDRPSRPGR